jgi:O-antigen/teichoic acid export membrane protein
MIHVIKQKFHSLVSDQRFSEILTGSAWALSARIFSTVLGFIFSIIVARLYGAEMVGILAVINSFLILVTIFTVFGTSTSILRFIPEHLSNYSPTSAFKIYRKIQSLVIIFSLATATFFFVGADLISEKIFSKPHLSYYFALASIFVVFKSLMLLNTNAVRGLSLIKFFAVLQILPHTFNLFFLILLGFFLPIHDLPVYAVLLGFAMTSIVGWFVVEITFRKKIKPADKIHNMPINAILSTSLPMLMTTTIMFVLGETGVLMVGAFCTEAEVGYYSIAVKLSVLTTFVLQAVNSIAAPKFVELFFTDKIDELFHVAKKSTKLIFFTTIPILICLLFFGKPLITFFFGKEFIQAYPALLVLIIGQFINSISGSTGMFMNMTGNQKVFRNIMLVGGIINVGLNLIFINRFGIIGAAFSTSVSVCFWNVCTLLYMKKNYGNTTAYFPSIRYPKKFHKMNWL